MEPSTYMLLWNQTMATRDANVVSLALMAMAIVVTWLLMDIAPKGLSQALYYAYIAGGLGLYAFTIVLGFWTVLHG